MCSRITPPKAERGLYHPVLCVFIYIYLYNIYRYIYLGIFKYSKKEGRTLQKGTTSSLHPPAYVHTHNEKMKYAQLGVVNEEAGMLFVLVAVAPVKPVGGAMELWLGCRSLGMPL